MDSGARNECIHLVRARVFLNLYECKSTLAKGWLAAWTAMQCNESSMVASRDIGDFVGKVNDNEGYPKVRNHGEGPGWGLGPSLG